MHPLSVEPTPSSFLRVPDRLATS